VYANSFLLTIPFYYTITRNIINDYYKIVIIIHYSLNVLVIERRIVKVLIYQSLLLVDKPFAWRIDRMKKLLLFQPSWFFRSSSV